MEYITSRSLLLAIAATFFGGVLVFLFQDVWRDRAQIIIDIIPNSIFNAEEMELTDYHLKKVIEDKNSGELFPKPNDVDTRFFLESLNIVVSELSARKTLDGNKCAYQITVNNTGTLPAEDAFIKIDNLVVYAEYERGSYLKSKSLNEIKNNTIQLGQIKQGTSLRIVAYSKYDCVNDIEDLVAGHSLGTANLRYAKIPFIFPDFFTQYPEFILLTFVFASLICLVFLIAIASTLLTQNSKQLEPPKEVKRRSKKT